MASERQKMVNILKHKEQQAKKEPEIHPALSLGRN
ncbi:hypothetical protein VIMY103929_20025 [Vibrio mytili]